MTAPTPPVELQPSHKHRALALRVVLAWLRGDYDVLPMLAAECATPADVDMFVCAMTDSFARVARKRLKDPEGYVESWLAVESAAAEAERPLSADEWCAVIDLHDIDPDEPPGTTTPDHP